MAKALMALAGTFARAISCRKMVFLLALFSLLAWSYLAFGRGGFWRADQRLALPFNELPAASVIAVIPARNEAKTIGKIINAHLNASYTGTFSVTLVDDHSTDNTAAIAREAANDSDRLTIINAKPLPAGWTGKLWAMHQGIAEAQRRMPDYILLADADICFAPDTLTRLVTKAKTENLALTSLMARLDARGFWGGLLVPAFIFFFQKLYPFPLSNDPAENVAAAAGGCMLVNAKALAQIDGVSRFRNTLIDDCALAREIKNISPTTKTWIGLAKDEAISLRDNRSLSSIWTMVARTAFAQLQFSPMILIGSILGMGLLYLIPPFLVLGFACHLDVKIAFIAMAAWAILSWLYLPTLRLYEKPVYLAPLLPVAALFYMMMTIDSALRHWRGQGGAWKGRYYQSDNLS